MNLGNNLFGMLGSSDSRLKTNITKVGTDLNGFNVYTWDWNSKAYELGLADQPTIGVMAQEVKEVYPEAISIDSNGYYVVDYAMLEDLNG